ncbi:putative E3 ubiquitin-protein ligase XBAT35 isoform X2 [Impatiens glandulifera]|uniref:putative E3 ubiquitin-protein ligase XBAT35 isoform X2 n=1 Tax=Impatiens glandulifera TaxID=253017 RepID=UPI001FB11C9D|nr:putative E3 ubiquitin-protein ligase XBAT35 isoform X2 [Impatiens glandulifera]
MGQQQSKDELLYQQVNYGNTEGIKSLRREGAGLEWMDKEGKTPLILACMNPGLYNVAKTLIDLGANVNAYRGGRHAGTPLHHAAKRGLQQTVKLLLANGANALIMNDDCQTPLDVARAKGNSNVVRAIENHICLFSGWLREIYGPGFLEVFAPQLLSRKVWVVVLPIGSRNFTRPFKLELAMYSSDLDAQPRSLIPLWKANLDEPNFSRPDPTVIIADIAKKTRIKLGSANESDKQQLQQFCNACKGIPQVMRSNFPFNTQVPIAPPPATGPTPAPAQPPEEEMELAMAIRASMNSAMEAGPSHTNNTNASSSSSFNSWDTSKIPYENPVEVVHTPAPETSVPSAPPIEQAIIEDDGPIHYPSIDADNPVDLSSSTTTTTENVTNKTWRKEDTDSSSCVICLDAPVEGACIPCGHMAGCMSCLNEIKGKKWGCPVCRANIDQVVRLYAV